MHRRMESTKERLRVEEDNLDRQLQDAGLYEEGLEVEMKRMMLQMLEDSRRSAEQEERQRRHWKQEQQILSDILSRCSKTNPEERREVGSGKEKGNEDNSRDSDVVPILPGEGDFDATRRRSPEPPTGPSAAAPPPSRPSDALAPVAPARPRSPKGPEVSTTLNAAPDRSPLQIGETASGSGDGREDVGPPGDVERGAEEKRGSGPPNERQKTAVEARKWTRRRSSIEIVPSPSPGSEESDNRPPPWSRSDGEEDGVQLLSPPVGHERPLACPDAPGDDGARASTSLKVRAVQRTTRVDGPPHASGGGGREAPDVPQKASRDRERPRGEDLVLGEDGGEGEDAAAPSGDPGLRDHRGKRSVDVFSVGGGDADVPLKRRRLEGTEGPSRAFFGGTGECPRDCVSRIVDAIGRMMKRMEEHQAENVRHRMKWSSPLTTDRRLEDSLDRPGARGGEPEDAPEEDGRSRRAAGVAEADARGGGDRTDAKRRGRKRGLRSTPTRGQPRTVAAPQEGKERAIVYASDDDDDLDAFWFGSSRRDARTEVSGVREGADGGGGAGGSGGVRTRPDAVGRGEAPDVEAHRVSPARGAGVSEARGPVADEPPRQRGTAPPREGKSSEGSGRRVRPPVVKRDDSRTHGSPPGREPSEPAAGPSGNACAVDDGALEGVGETPGRGAARDPIRPAPLRFKRNHVRAPGRGATSREPVRPAPLGFKRNHARNKREAATSGSRPGLEIGADKTTYVERPSTQELSDDDPTGGGTEKENEKKEMMPCPLCQRFFPVGKIEIHASDCSEQAESPQKQAPHLNDVARKGRRKHFHRELEVEAIKQQPESSFTSVITASSEMRTPAGHERCMICKKIFKEGDEYTIHVTSCEAMKEIQASIATPPGTRSPGNKREAQRGAGHTPSQGMGANRPRTGSLFDHLEESKEEYDIPTSPIKNFIPISKQTNSLINYHHQFRDRSETSVGANGARRGRKRRWTRKKVANRIKRKKLK